MKQFEIHFISHFTIEANNLREANELFEKQKQVFIRDIVLFDEEYDLFTETLSFYDCEESKDHEVIGHCEISGLSIFEEDDYHYDSEGIMWLKEFDETPEGSEPPSFEEFCEKNELGERDVHNDVNEHLDRL